MMGDELGVPEDDLEFLGRTLDEELSRWPISPDKVCKYYRLSFDEEDPDCQKRIANDCDEVNIEKLSQGNLKRKLNNFDQQTTLRQIEETAPNRTLPESTEHGSSETESSLITIKAFETATDGAINKASTGEQLSSTIDSYKPSVVEQWAKSCDSDIINFVEDSLIETTGLKDLQHEFVGSCVPCSLLTEEKVNTVSTAVVCNQKSSHIPCILLQPCTNSGDDSVVTFNRDLTENIDETIDSSSLPEYLSDDYAMYGYNRDSGIRRYHDSSNSISSSVRSQGSSYRTQYGRPTMISSLSSGLYGSSPRSNDISYGNSSLRRSTSAGPSSRPFYSSSGSLVNRDRASHVVSMVSRTPSYSGMARESYLSTSPNLSSREHCRHLPTCGIVSRPTTHDSNNDYSNSSRVNQSTYSQSHIKYDILGWDRGSTSNTNSTGNFVSSENDDAKEPSQRMRPSTENNSIAINKADQIDMRATNLLEDRPVVDSSKVVSQVVDINKTYKKPEQCSYNRQIWSRPDDSANKSSVKSYSSNTANSHWSRDFSLTADYRTRKPDGHAAVISDETDRKTELELHDTYSSDTTVAQEADYMTEIYSYCQPSPIVTAVDSRSITDTMGSNVHSTQSPVSQEVNTAGDVADGSNESFEDLVRSARSRRKSQDEKSIFSEETSSFVFRDGQWVQENSTDDTDGSGDDLTEAHSQIMRPLLFGPVVQSTSLSPDDLEDEINESFHTPSDEVETEPWEFVDVVTSVSDLQSKSVKTDTDETYLSKGDHPGGKSEEGCQMADRDGDLSNNARTDRATMDLCPQRMNIVSNFEILEMTGEISSNSESDPCREQQVVTEIIDIPFSPPTFTVGDTCSLTSGQPDEISRQEVCRASGSGVVVAAASPSSDITSVSSRVTDGSTSDVMVQLDEHESSPKECVDQSVDKSRQVSDNIAAGSLSTEYHTSQQAERLTVNSPTQIDSPIFFSRKNANLSSGHHINKEGEETDSGPAESDAKSMGAVHSSTPGSYRATRSHNSNYRRETQSKPVQAVTESRPITERPSSGDTPGGPDRVVSLDLLRECFLADTNVNTRNDVDSGPSPVNKTDSNSYNTVNQVSVPGFSDLTNTEQDTVGENNSLCVSEKNDSLSLAERPGAATPLTGNNSAHESHTPLNSTADSNRYTSDSPDLEEDMSNREVSRQQGGTYYTGNINRRNVTRVLASDSEDRRQALALSQTETQRMGEMVQTNNTPGNRSELRQTHSGQTFTKRASGAEVSKQGDKTRVRDVSQTVDRSRTETEHVAESPTGDADVSKVREDRESRVHQDRQEQTQVKNGTQLKQTSSSKSESNQVSRVIESGDCRSSQRQERHFKSSSVTRSSRSSEFSSNNRLCLAAEEDSSLSDNDSEPGVWLHIEERGSREDLSDSRGNQLDKQERTNSERENGQRKRSSGTIRETVVHDHKAAEMITNSVTKTDKEGSVNLDEQVERAGMDRGVTRTTVSPDQGIIRTQRVQQRAQVQTASRTTSAGNSTTDGSGTGDSGTVSAEDESVLLAAILGRLEEKEIPPFTPDDYQQTNVAPTVMRSQADWNRQSDALALIRGNRQTEINDDAEPALSPEEQTRAIERARQEFQAQQEGLQRKVTRKRTIIVDEEMMEEMFLRCIICRERYNTDSRVPKLLPCHHTFCLNCLKEMFRVECEYRQGLTSAFRDAAPNFVSIQCPTCRTTHMITDKEYKNFKSDHKLLELLEISSLPAKGAIGYCKTHRTQSTDHFCETCIQPVCSDCKVLDHPALDDHVVYSRSDALKLYANQARNTLADVEAEDLELADMEQKLKTAIGYINNRLGDSEQSIRQTFEKFKVAINNRQDQLLEKIENEMGKRKEDFSKDLDEITKRMETMDKTQTTTKQAQEDEDVEKMFTAHQSAREMLKNTFEMSNDPNSNVKASFFYEKRDRANINNTVSDHGLMTFQS